MGRLYRKLLSTLLFVTALVTAQEAFATDYTPIILVGLLALGVVTIFFAGVISMFGIGATSSFGLALLIMGITFLGFWIYPQFINSLKSVGETTMPERGVMLDTNEPIS